MNEMKNAPHLHLIMRNALHWNIFHIKSHIKITQSTDLSILFLLSNNGASHKNQPSQPLNDSNILSDL